MGRKHCCRALATLERVNGLPFSFMKMGPDTIPRLLRYLDKVLTGPQTS